MKRSMYAMLLLLSAALVGGCESFLDKNPDKKLALPTSLTDLQALLDDYGTLNEDDPAGSAETSADNYYLPAPTWAAMSNEAERRKYIWAEDNLFRIGYRPNDWYEAYGTIYYANTVLQALPGIARTAANATDWDNLKGQASYYRAQALLTAAAIWAPAYDEQTAAADLGLPLPQGTNFNEQLTRSSVQQTYDQILGDLQTAAALLPVSVPHVMRPSKAAAYALLARAYLSMRQYPEAGAYADSSLLLHDGLLDYNTLDTAASYPFPRFNAEVLHESMFGAPQPLTVSRARIDTLLYKMYADDDLRKTLFFKETAEGGHSFRGSYEGTGSNFFAGVATDEVYLVQAESRARAGDVAGAMASLNILLRSRWRTGTFTDVTAADAAEALALVLQERRKELLLRGLRWMDIKRRNKEAAAITLQRVLDGKEYVLPPGDLRFALPLPEDVVALSGMAQNPR